MEIDVASYLDSAHGTMSELKDGVYWVSEVILHPKITYVPRRSATAAAEARLHEMAHDQCFIEQSIKTRSRCVPLRDKSARDGRFAAVEQPPKKPDSSYI